MDDVAGVVRGLLVDLAGETPPAEYDLGLISNRFALGLGHIKGPIRIRIGFWGILYYSKNKELPQ